jgi:hypothetical protein
MIRPAIITVNVLYGIVVVETNDIPVSAAFPISRDFCALVGFLRLSKKA